jgi:conjugative relaxase-like TrwC/TraI family protein
MVATVGRCYTNPQDYAQENYYTQGDALSNAEWFGQAANIQGLTDQIQEKHFHNAYQALDPQGNPLRKQQNYRKQSKRQNRPGTDVTLSAPKSISVAALVMGNTAILEAHKSAVRATMDYVEKHCIFYQTKQQGQKKLLQSNTAQIAIFHHDDNRNKDPQLHSHCVILNQTQCPDGKWRAVANAQLYIQQKTIGAYYAHELAGQLKAIGWEVEWTDDHTFELAGVNKEKLDAIFSTRSNQIEAELAKLGLTRKTATAEQKQALCLKTRKEKRYHLEPEDRERQLAEWKQKATEAGIEMTLTPRHRLENTYQQPSHPGSIPQLIHSATETLTERTTAFHSHELLKECLRQSQGNYNAQEIQSELAHFSQLIPTHDGRLTTQGQLKREQKIIQLVQQAQDNCSPLTNTKQVKAISQTRGLNRGQTTALNHIATSRNGVVLVQGNAGVGKTYTMKALKDLIDGVTLDKGQGDKGTGRQGDKENSSINVQIRGLAPSAAAADVLQVESGISLTG